VAAATASFADWEKRRKRRRRRRRRMRGVCH